MWGKIVTTCFNSKKAQKHRNKAVQANERTAGVQPCATTTVAHGGTTEPKTHSWTAAATHHKGHVASAERATLDDKPQADAGQYKQGSSSSSLDLQAALVAGDMIGFAVAAHPGGVRDASSPAALSDLGMQEQQPMLVLRGSSAGVCTDDNLAAWDAIFASAVEAAVAEAEIESWVPVCAGVPAAAAGLVSSNSVPGQYGGGRKALGPTELDDVAAVNHEPALKRPVEEEPYRVLLIKSAAGITDDVELSDCWQDHLQLWAAPLP